MDKFVNKVDGSVFYARPGTIQFRVLSNDINFKAVEEADIDTNYQSIVLGEEGSIELLSELTVKELKEIAKENGFEGYSNMKKEELLDLLGTLGEFEDGE